MYLATVVSKLCALKEGFNTMWYEQERLKTLGFRAGELEKAKNIIMQRLENLYERNNLPSETYMRKYLFYFLYGEAAPGIQNQISFLR